MTVTIPDYTYTSNDCEKAPWTADIQGPAYNYFSIQATASPSATVSPSGRVTLVSCLSQL